ncbi:MAG: hypothetical protein LUO95_01670 [Methylococcaceae bacterium]|nr:hypothetical protein [Methylococcaceae bacterium]
MDWQPISELEILDNIILAEARMNIEQQRFWNTIKINPKKWQQTTYGDGDEGNGFWAVAVIEQFVIWFNDIEDGFNVSTYKQYGVIEEYWCNQDKLEWTIQSLLDLIHHGYSSPKRGAPQPL